MPTTTIEVHVRHLASLAILDLAGDITGQAEPALREAHDEASARDPAAVLLNFSAVGYINSTGIALLVGLLARARDEQRRVIAYGLTEHYAEIFRITRLSDFMSIQQDEEAAISSAKG